MMKKRSFYLALAALFMLACQMSAYQGGAVAVPSKRETAAPTVGAVAMARGVCALVVSSGALHVRRAPALDGEVVGYLDRGAVVEVLDQADSMWWRVRVPGLDGYARSIYLVVVDCAMMPLARSRE